MSEYTDRERLDYLDNHGLSVQFEDVKHPGLGPFKWFTSDKPRMKYLSSREAIDSAMRRNAGKDL